jgi:hypothetical protein
MGVEKGMTAKPQHITIELLSDTTFGSGDSTAGAVDVEVDHDRYGLPMLGGKAVRGLLRDAWLSMQDHFSDLRSAAMRVFGPHADLNEAGILRIGDALVPGPARRFFAAAVDRSDHPIEPQALFEAFTEVRSQTAEARETGAPARTTLRAVRVVVRGLELQASLRWLAEPKGEDMQCLALAVLGVRHAGLARNRGRGHFRMALDGDVLRTRELASRGGA